MQVSPMKVLLVAREEPYSLYETKSREVLPSKEALPAGQPLMPFVIERVDCTPQNSCDAPDFFGHDAYVLPAGLFLELEASLRPFPAIVYGSVDLARACFEEGATDFMRELWTLPELEARLYHLWQPEVAFGESILFLRGNTVQRRDRNRPPQGLSATLSPQEAIILRALMSAPYRTIPAEQLTRIARLPSGNSRALGMHIARIRAKLAKLGPDLAPHIRTIRGRGFSLHP